MADAQENKWTPGIVVLKDVALYEPGFERLGPPPGNAGVLIRGGAAWVFGVEPQPPAQGIVKLDVPPSGNEVADALAREMAWRWLYGHGPFVKSPGAARGVSAMARKFHRYAEINLVRWSRIARQTGFYEWMYGRNSLVPRIYSGRLQNALRDGYDVARARVFLAEAEPHLGLDGIKFYEAARLLWDRNASVEQVRDEYCEALFGGVGTPVGRAMRQYFEALERIWCGRDKIERISRPGTPMQAGDPPLQRLASGFNLGTFGGYGACGCLGWISELDPYMRSTADVIAHRVPRIPEESEMTPVEPVMPFFAANGPWRSVQSAYSATSPGTVLRQRVQFFRCAIGLTALLIRLYRPILEMWMQVERHFESEFNPLDWTRMHEMGTMVALGQLGARAAAAVPADVRVALGTALNNVEWVTAVGFRRSVRDPVHSYLAGIGTVAGLGGELGLGLSRVPYVSGGTNRIEFGSQQTPEGAQRSAFYLRYINDYITWWNDHGRIPRRSATNQSDNGMGVSMFLMMKEVIATMMILSGQPPVGETVMRMFSVQDCLDFLRDA